MSISEFSNSSPALSNTSLLDYFPSSPIQISDIPTHDRSLETVSISDSHSSLISSNIEEVNNKSNSKPIIAAEETHSMQTFRLPISLTLKSKVPVQKTFVPTQKTVHEANKVVSNVISNKKQTERYTKLVPVQFTRIINVPTVEKRVEIVPTVNYVTEMQEKIHFVTEMVEQLKTVTEYETRTIPTVKKRIITRHENVQILPPEDLPSIRNIKPNFILSNIAGSAALSKDSY